MVGNLSNLSHLERGKSFLKLVVHYTQQRREHCVSL